MAGCNSSENDEIDNAQVYQVEVAAKPTYAEPGTMHVNTLYVIATGLDGPDVRAGAITGFNHRFGSSYRLEIRRYPSTSSNEADYVHELVQVLEENEDPAGTVYEYPQVTLVDEPVYVNSQGSYMMGPYPFLCGEGVDCDTLVEMNQSGGVVRIELTLTGGDIPVTLTDWD
ncbi:hypothetical protein [Aliidiomarina soli]|uniref:hypothetical protein n=1 Tax=Aliidiomarina soli TaxID=1928574 RepID=UPI000F87F92D|nr:hypothetical protein [Aliidiomarina soli]